MSRRRVSQFATTAEHEGRFDGAPGGFSYSLPPDRPATRRAVDGVLSAVRPIIPTGTAREVLVHLQAGPPRLSYHATKTVDGDDGAGVVYLALLSSVVPVLCN